MQGTGFVWRAEDGEEEDWVTRWFGGSMGRRVKVSGGVEMRASSQSVFGSFGPALTQEPRGSRGFVGLVAVPGGLRPSRSRRIEAKGTRGKKEVSVMMTAVGNR
uniref:Uncharacterized protein n=1 Tax=Coccidioides posadasii RMSCC 3488 TaxID=454284 RepID=A0A0J6F5P7_COCPO|nr:hypothetical protein CPAG_01867 [Coccidioides posadasii RMSCC 3488]